MNLNIQLQVLTVSFVYGIIVAYLLRFQYKYLFDSKLLYKLIITMLFVFDNILLYFLILRLINYGQFHIYFFFMIVIGYVLGNKLIYKK